jgi:hypothetical protein
MSREISAIRPRRFPLVEANGRPKEHAPEHKTNSFDQGLGKMPSEKSTALPNATGYLKMDSYHHYRAMILAASLPDEPQISIDSPTADHPFAAGYTDIDQQIIDRAAELCGFAATKLGSKRSVENDFVHKISPHNANSGKHPK